MDHDTIEMYDFPIDRLAEDAGMMPFSGYDLEGSVHPVFASQNFEAGIEYDALLPTLRLASRFLTTDCLLRYWYVSHFAKCVTLMYPKGSGKEGQSYDSAFPPHEEMTDEDIAKTKEFLFDLASVVRFRFKASTQPGSHGYARPCRGQLLDMQGPAFFGNRSEICFDCDYQKIIQLHRSNGQSQPTEEQLLLYFNVAMTFTHELAHVAHIARHGENKPEMPLGYRNIAEAGYDWQESVLDGSPLFSDGQLIFEEWPCPGARDRYVYDANLIELHGPLRDRLTRIWRVPLGWALQMFQSRFWDETVVARGADALKAPKLVGLRFFHYGTRFKCHCSTCQAYPWDGKKLTVAADIFEDDPVRSPTCQAFMVFDWMSYTDERSLLEGVPDGYEVLEDGTLVLQKYLGEFQTPLAYSKRERRAAVKCREALRRAEDRRSVPNKICERPAHTPGNCQG